MDNGTLTKMMKDWIKDAGLWGEDKYFVSFELINKDNKENLEIRTTKPGAFIGLKGKIIDKYSYAFKTLGINHVDVLPIKHYFSGKSGV